jgi:hypothetical protein
MSTQTRAAPLVLFDVYLEEIFYGCTWARTADEAIETVVGELAFDGDGERAHDFRAVRYERATAE